jgi:hypothetical protein
VIRHARELALGCLLLVASAIPAISQPGRTAPDDDRPRSEADETFDLDVTERRIIERDLHAATDVEAGGPDQGWNLRIGASASARHVDIRLRGIRGHVRFRASLAPVLDPIRRRDPAPGRDGGADPAGR